MQPSHIFAHRFSGVIFPVAHESGFSNSYLLYQWAADHESDHPVQATVMAPSYTRGVPVFTLKKGTSDSETEDETSESESSDSELEERAFIGRKFVFPSWDPFL